jgi:hypothetical protein
MRFLKENPSAGFVLAFQALLVTCAVMLVFGLSSLAEGLAVVAYFALVADVVLQLVWFVRRPIDGE